MHYLTWVWYHNIIRYRSYESNGDKVYPKTLDRYMNKLISRADISMAWACIESDIDLQTGHKWVQIMYTLPM